MQFDTRMRNQGRAAELLSLRNRVRGRDGASYDNMHNRFDLAEDPLTGRRFDLAEDPLIGGHQQDISKMLAEYDDEELQFSDESQEPDLQVCQEHSDSKPKAKANDVM